MNTRADAVEWARTNDVPLSSRGWTADDATALPEKPTHDVISTGPGADPELEGVTRPRGARIVNRWRRGVP